MIDEVLYFLAQKYPEKKIDENTPIFDIVDGSIDFLVLICDIEEKTDKTFPLEEVDDITKLTVKVIAELLNREANEAEFGSNGGI